MSTREPAAARRVREIEECGETPENSERDALRVAIRDAIDAINRAVTLLGPPADPVMTATSSALTCADALVALHRDGRDEDVTALREAVGAARALVGEVTYALRDRYGYSVNTDNGHRPNPKRPQQTE